MGFPLEVLHSHRLIFHKIVTSPYNPGKLPHIIILFCCRQLLPFILILS